MLVGKVDAAAAPSQSQHFKQSYSQVLCVVEWSGLGLGRRRKLVQQCIPVRIK